jgi:hypothetical protein
VILILNIRSFQDSVSDSNTAAPIDVDIVIRGLTNRDTLTSRPCIRTARLVTMARSERDEGLQSPKLAALRLTASIADRRRRSCEARIRLLGQAILRSGLRMERETGSATAKSLGAVAALRQTTVQFGTITSWSLSRISRPSSNWNHRSGRPIARSYSSARSRPAVGKLGLHRLLKRGIAEHANDLAAVAAVLALMPAADHGSVAEVIDELGPRERDALPWNPASDPSF